MRVIFGKNIVTDPEVLAGKPVIRGTRIPVDLILKKLAEDIKKSEANGDEEDIAKLKEEYAQYVTKLKKL